MAAERCQLLHDIPLLNTTESSIQLAAQLLRDGIIPLKAASDALHIALASVHKINYLVTWNFRHIANPF